MEGRGSEAREVDDLVIRQPEKGRGSSLQSRPALLFAPGLEPAPHSPVLPALAEILVGPAPLPAWKRSLDFSKSKCIRKNPSSRSRHDSHACASGFPQPSAPQFPKQRCFIPAPLNPESARRIPGAPRTWDCAQRRTSIQEVRPGVLIVSEHNVKAKLK